MNDTPNHMLITMAKMNYLVESILIKFIVMDIFYISINIMEEC